MRFPTVRSLLNYFKRDDHSFFNALIKKGWSPWAMGFCLAVLLGVPLTGSKIWPSTPDHIRPEIKISLLDWIESRSYFSKAEKIAIGKAKGDLIHTLKMALRSHPGNQTVNRQLLQTLVLTDRRREHWQQAVDTTFWTLQLSQTNTPDLELACSVLKHYHLDTLHLELLEGYQGKKTPYIEKSYLEALFSNHRLEDVQVCLQKSRAMAKVDADFQLYEAAILGTTSDGAHTEAAHRIIENAVGAEKTAELASRLQMFLAQKQGDIQFFEQAFTRLIHRFEDTTEDHLDYWDLLKQVGKIEKAQEAATAYSFRPKSAKEVVAAADSLTGLHLKDMAYQYLVNYADAFELDESNWHAQSQLLTEDQEWEKLQRLALTIRSESKASPSFIAYSYFLEGKALIENDQRDAAETAFSRISEYSMTGSDLSLRVGSSLWTLGYPSPAYAVLSPERTRYRNSNTYWELMLDVNKSLQNSSQMLMAVENLIRLDPENPSYLIEHSTYVLAQRHRCEEALTITTGLLDRYSEAPIVRLNHGYALVLNDRLKDAQSLLSNVDESILESPDQHRYLLAWMELHFRTGELGEAWKTGRQITPKELLPEERAHYRNMWNGLQLEDPSLFQPNLSQVSQQD